MLYFQTMDILWSEIIHQHNVIEVVEYETIIFVCVWEAQIIKIAQGEFYPIEHTLSIEDVI
jgi:hypothetical protein